MKVEATKIPGLLVIEPAVYGDATERLVGPLIPWEDRVRDVLGQLEP